MNLYNTSALTNAQTGQSEQVTVTADNQTQVSNLWSYATSITNAYGTKGELTQQGVENYFNAIGMPAYMADKFFTDNQNTNGKVDVMGLTKTFVAIDNAGQNPNGALDFQDWMNLYSNTSGVTENITDSNRAQLQSLWGAASSIVQGYDTSGNKELSSAEFYQWFKTLGMTQDMATEFVNEYGGLNGSTTGTKSIDTMELLSALTTVDTNGSGALDAGELINLLQNIFPAETIIMKLM